MSGTETKAECGQCSCIVLYTSKFCVFCDAAEEILGELHDKKILIIGAGEMADLVGRSLAARGIDAIFIANRTFERAEEMAAELGGVAVKYDEIEAYLTNKVVSYP